MIHEKLLQIQLALKVPKGQYNKFGNYDYRSCEDILEAVKPVLKEHDCTLTLSDTVKQVGERYYIESTASLTSDGETLTVTASAREAENKKGMDDSQITGSASSYARKYALNGLFCIDDTKDADTDEYTVQQNKNSSAQQNKKADKPKINNLGCITSEQGQAIKAWLPKVGMTEEKLLSAYKVKSLSQIPDKEYPKIIKRFEEMAAQNG